MSLTQADFSLTDAQIELINRHFESVALRHAQAGEEPPGSVSVTFSWIPGLGRMVEARFDGEIDGLDIPD